MGGKENMEMKECGSGREFENGRYDFRIFRLPIYRFFWRPRLQRSVMVTWITLMNEGFRI